MERPLVSFETALTVAALGLAAKLLFDKWSRHHERIAVAAAIVGELEAYLLLLQPEKTIPAYKGLIEYSREVRIRILQTFPQFPSNHPVFDKVCDKIGCLDPQDARDISRIYNVVTNFRLVITGMTAEHFLNADDHIQIARVRALTEMMEREVPIANALIYRLGKVAKYRSWDWILR